MNAASAAAAAAELTDLTAACHDEAAAAETGAETVSLNAAAGAVTGDCCCFCE
mgnify:CR=1 FL=1